ncbi:Wzz/FepE/Etk N-terminal domain-containing protein [Limnohabitans sp.]|uniref:Wzz/FepE/Etk N-terminal domain-containing protein n=1 Tax=Limnohabitans sp. TaxID=1907725 RepID=UPI00286ED792|nr:Wzz/FepE/Etk N-terminal domain-containing protein [Limnohabitans sp.]
MTEQMIHNGQEDEISFLDILVTLAESWKLLVFGPLVAGVIAGGVSFLWPPTFESVAIVRLTEEEVALLHAAPLLDPLIERFGFLQKADGIKDDARSELKKHLSYAIDKKTKLATVVSKGATPEAAQALGQAAMDALFIELQPKGKEKEAILQEININNQSIADGVYLIERHRAKENSLYSAKAQTVNLKLNNLELGLRLQAKGKEVFAQEPSFPQRKTSPKLGLVVLLAMLMACFALLMFVFIRKAWVAAAQNEDTADRFKGGFKDEVQQR